MIKILVCDPDFVPTIAAVRTSLLIKIAGWQQKGAKVTLICSSEAKTFYEKQLPDTVIYTFPFTWKSKTRWTVSLEFIRTNILMFPYIFVVPGKFDIIYSFSSTLELIFFPFVLTLLDRRIKWFSIVDNVVPKPHERPGNYLLKLIPYLAFLVSNRMLRNTTGIFVVTSLLKKRYEKMGIKVIKTGTGNGLDIKSFTKEISPKTPKFTALFGGRIHPAKGIFDLVEITKLITKEDKNFTLGIMGEGEKYMKEKLRKTIRKNHLSKHIFLLGHKNSKERWDLYRSSNFFLFPSYAEGCPQVVLEAFAANKLVIGYKLPEYLDAFRKYIKTGELKIFEKGDVFSIVKFIQSSKNKKFIFTNKISDYSWNTIITNEWNTFCKFVR